MLCSFEAIFQLIAIILLLRTYQYECHFVDVITVLSRLFQRPTPPFPSAQYHVKTRSPVGDPSCNAIAT